MRNLRRARRQYIRGLRAGLGPGELCGCEAVGGGLAGAAVAHHFVGELLTLVEAAEDPDRKRARPALPDR